MAELKKFNQYREFLKHLNIKSNVCVAAVKTSGINLEWENGVLVSSGFWGFKSPEQIEYLIVFYEQKRSPTQLWYSKVMGVTHKDAPNGKGVVYRMHLCQSVLSGTTSNLWTVFTENGKSNGFRILQQGEVKAGSGNSNKTTAMLPLKPVGNMHPERVLTTKAVFQRSDEVRDYALLRAGQCCQGCNNLTPPLFTEGKTVFLEIHHVKFLRDSGPDTPCNTVAICPRCHKRAHHSHDKEIFAEHLYAMNAFLKRY